MRTIRNYIICFLICAYALYYFESFKFEMWPLMFVCPLVLHVIVWYAKEVVWPAKSVYGTKPEMGWWL